MLLRRLQGAPGSKVLDRHALLCWTITVERPLRLNFAAAPGRSVNPFEENVISKRTDGEKGHLQKAPTETKGNRTVYAE